MKIVLIITLAGFTLITIGSAAVITQNTISSILQEIMSPANTEKAMQIINTAASRTNKNIVVPTYANDCGIPARIGPAAIYAKNDLMPAVYARNEVMPAIYANSEMPARIISNGNGLPRMIVNDGVTRIVGTERNIANSDRISPIQQKVAKVREVPCAANMIDSRFLYQNTPMNLPRDNTNCYGAYSTFSELPEVTSYSNPYLPMTASISNPFMPVGASNPLMPVGAPNPFMPVASPMSSYMPSLLPPPTESKGQYLRKIPIPPPTI